MDEYFKNDEYPKTFEGYADYHGIYTSPISDYEEKEYEKDFYIELKSFWVQLESLKKQYKLKVESMETIDWREIRTPEYWKSDQMKNPINKYRHKLKFLKHV